MSWAKGYKAFNKVKGKPNQGECNGFIFQEGKTYEIEGDLKICSNGFHACKEWVLCLAYYPDHDNNLYAEVELIGDVQYEEPTKHKAATSKIKIIRFIDVCFLDGKNTGNCNSGNCNSGDRNSGDWNSGNCNSGDCNSGDWNSGNCNSGDWNSGNCNSGDYNSGDCNSGDRNSGDCNSGNCNSGDCNSGDRNSGNCNSGDWNSGDCNSGDYNSGDWNSGNCNSGDWNSGNCNSGGWNSCSRESGFFNSENSKYIRVFNKKCLLNDWDEVEKPNFLYFDIDRDLGYKESFKKAFENASHREIELLKALPNFDAKVFYDISGIDIYSID